MKLQNILINKIFKEIILKKYKYLIFLNTRSESLLGTQYLSKQNCSHLYFLNNKIKNLKFPIFIFVLDPGCYIQTIKSKKNFKLLENSIFLVKINFLFFKSLNQFLYYRCLNPIDLYLHTHKILMFVVKFIRLKKIL